MSTSSWSTIAQVRILDGTAPARDAVRAAITRSFETLGVPVGAAGAAEAAPADQPFGVETAGRRFPSGHAALAPAGCGPATVELVGDVDAIDRVAAVLRAEFATEHVFDDPTTLTLRVHPDTYRPGLRTGR